MSDFTIGSVRFHCHGVGDKPYPKVTGLRDVVVNSRVVHCTSNQHGHQLPITDCNCEICDNINDRAALLGIGLEKDEPILWKPVGLK